MNSIDIGCNATACAALTIVLAVTCAGTTGCGATNGGPHSAQGADDSGVDQESGFHPDANSGRQTDSAADGSPADAPGNADADSSRLDAGTGTVPTDGSADTGTNQTTCGSFSTGYANCDACIRESCCGEALWCDTPDDGGVDDAGQTRCEQMFFCTAKCAAPASDGAAPLSYRECQDICSPAYTAAEYSNAMAVNSCAAISCPYDCPIAFN